MKRLASALITIFFFFTSHAVAGELVVRFYNFQLEPGLSMYLRLYRVPDEAVDWGEDVAGEFRLQAPLPDRVALGQFGAGRYALRGFVDTDGNQELTAGRKGRPQEPFGFSYALEKGRPSLKFKQAVFELGGDVEVPFSILSVPGCKESREDCLFLIGSKYGLSAGD